MTESKPRILMHISELGYGGAETSFIRLANYLASYADVTVVLFARHYEGVYSTTHHEPLNVPVMVLDEKTESGQLSRWLHRWRQLRKLKASHDVCISFLSGPNLLNTLAGYHEKTIISLRGTRFFDPASQRKKKHLFQNWLDPFIFKRAAAIVAVSAGLCYEVRRQAGEAAARKFTAIPPFVDREEFQRRLQEPAEEAFQSLKGQPVIASVGRLSVEKGFIPLVEVFAQVAKRVKGAKLLLIGDGPQEEALRQLCASLELTTDCYDKEVSSVIFAGHQKNPISLLKMAPVYAMASLTEGLPNVVLEALAAQCVVVASDVPWGSRSILWKNPTNVEEPYPTHQPTPADYGILMPRIDLQKHHEMWAKTFEECLLMTQWRERYAASGPQRLEDFEMQKVGPKWTEVIETVQQNAKEKHANEQ